MSVQGYAQPNVTKLMDKYKIENKELWLSVYQLESASGTSNLARTCNNIFGMKYPTKRATTAIGRTAEGFSIYMSIKDAVIDLKLFQLTYLKGFTREQTLKYLGESYAEDKNYLKKINKFLTYHKN